MSAGGFKFGVTACADRTEVQVYRDAGGSVRPLADCAALRVDTYDDLLGPRVPQSGKVCDTWYQKKLSGIVNSNHENPSTTPFHCQCYLGPEHSRPRY